MKMRGNGRPWVDMRANWNHTCRELIKCSCRKGCVMQMYNYVIWGKGGYDIIIKVNFLGTDTQCIIPNKMSPLVY